MFDEPEEHEPLKVTAPGEPAAPPVNSDAKKKEDAPISRRSFLRRAVRKTLKYGAIATTGATAITLLANKWSAPPDHPPKDYTELFDALDPDQPIGVLIVSVNGKEEQWVPRKITHAAWNTYVDKMNESYGTNWIPISNATMADLQDFAKQFNARFGSKNTELHVAANHHQGHFSDTQYAEMLKSIQAKSKRAVIYACGPDPKPYENSGCDYVILPRINERLLGPELSFKLSPGYIDLISMMRHTENPATIRARLDNRSYLEAARDKATHQVWPRVWSFRSPTDTPDNHGAVVSTQRGCSR
jgi:hypothetical protein